MKDNVKERIETLRREIARHDRAYYEEDAPVITDAEYDALFNQLRELEGRHPELVTPDSPTQRVGGRPIERFQQVTHSVAMLSVDNTYDAQQLREFDRRVAKGLGDRPYRYVVDPKIDGVAVSLLYEKGVFVQAATRGDGVTGDDITHNVREIRSVPQRLNGREVPQVIEVRGEIVWPKADFQRFNKQRLARGEATFANPRNAAAGTLKQLDPAGLADRKLLFVSHGFGRIEPLSVTAYSELMERLKGWGVPVSPYASGPYDSIEQIISRLGAWDEKRKDYPYETDGLVIKVDRLDQRAMLGATSRFPRWCIAYKFSGERAESKLLKVDFQVGKQGTITPRAVMEPMQLSGTTVRHASLHNFDQIDRLDVRVGDTVIVEKAGEIIPQVMGVVLEKRPKSARPIQRPTDCPVCGGEVEQDEGGVYLRCINPSCEAQIKERLIHFCGRGQMDIEGLGQVLVEKMVDLGWLESFADIYLLPCKAGKIAEIEIEQERTIKGVRKAIPVPFGKKRTEKLVEGIERSKKQPLSRLLAALNIRHVGASTAELLAEHFGSMDELMKATEDELQEVEGIGPELAGSIVRVFHSDTGRRIVVGLKDAGLNMSQPRRSERVDSALAGKTVVITGTLNRIGRQEAENLVKKLGGKATGTVSRNTDYVVAGENPGSKLQKAVKLGVKVLNELEFFSLAGL